MPAQSWLIQQHCLERWGAKQQTDTVGTRGRSSRAGQELGLSALELMNFSIPERVQHTAGVLWEGEEKRNEELPRRKGPQTSP